MERYGRPLADHARGMLDERPALDLGGGATLVMLRYLARFDVIARDWVVLVREEKEPVCELATSITAALLYLVAASSR